MRDRARQPSTSARVREAEVLRATLLALGARQDCRVWRNSVGFARDHRGQGIRFGLPGSADILGLLRVPLPDGTQLGRFLAVEVKSTTGRQSEEQRAFQRMVEAFGGLYVLARSAEEAVAAVEAAVGRAV